jgi:acetyltransferase-like isoleucine patch superfamily enzyme
MSIKTLFFLPKLLLRLNIVKTIYFNFHMLPFNKAIKFPFYLFGKVYLGNLSGKIILPDEVKRGMIKIGYKWIDLWPVSFLPTQIHVSGTLEFKGEAIVSGGANINVQSNDAIMVIGNDVLIGGGSVCKCLESIKIGDYTIITGNCNIMDCNMHFVKNIDTGVVTNYKGPIIIGNSCWINSGSIVTKGAVIPDYSISARNAFLSKDYREFGTNLFLVGSPAKPTSSKVQSFFSLEKQNECKQFFMMNRTKILQLEPGLETESGPREGF